MEQPFKILIEKHPDTYVAYPLGLKGVVVGQGHTYEDALADVRSAIAFHIETFGPNAPWRVPDLTNTRFIRDVYRPRIDLGYVWRDEHGRVLAERREQVSDLNYLMLADPYYIYNDPLRYEKAMLRRWFDERFGGGSYGIAGRADSH